MAEQDIPIGSFKSQIKLSGIDGISVGRSDSSGSVWLEASYGGHTESLTWNYRYGTLMAFIDGEMKYLVK